VVLPFVNLSGDPAREYFSDAMTDEIITDLASLAPAQLAVIARTSAMHYKGKQKNVSQIGRELGMPTITTSGFTRSRSIRFWIRYAPIRGFTSSCGS
jgi:adenylate cyclase